MIEKPETNYDKVSSFCASSGIRPVTNDNNLVKSHARENDEIWLRHTEHIRGHVTKTFRKDKSSHDGQRKGF